MPMRENTHVVHLTAEAAQRGERLRTLHCSRRAHLSQCQCEIELELTSLQSAGRRPHAVCRTTNGRPSVNWRSVIKKLIAALALVALIAVPTLTTSASAQVSPASPTFGSNGY